MKTHPWKTEQRIYFHCVHCGKEMQQYGTKTIGIDDHHLHLLIESCDCDFARGKDLETKRAIDHEPFSTRHATSAISKE